MSETIEEGHPIWKAIDRGGGQGCDIRGILNWLDLCGYVIVPKDRALGPTGEFPEGKLAPDDEGGLAVAVGFDQEHGVIRIDFGSPVKWIAIPPAGAIAFAGALIEKAAVAALAMAPAEGTG